MFSAIFSKVDNRTLVLGGLDVLVIIILSALLIFRNPAPQIKTQDNEKQYRDSIAVLDNRYLALQNKINSLTKTNDSLINLKTNIQIVYSTKIKYIQTAPLDTVAAFVRRSLRSN